MRVLGFTGSLRRDSYNRTLLRAAAPLFPRGVVFGLWSGIADLPIYDEDLDSGEPPPAAVRLRTDIAAAGALLLATPEYNSSIPGGLKNALDWASRPYATNVLRQKPVAVIGASTGFFGAVWAQAELRRVLESCGARVLDRQLPLARAFEAFAADGSLADPALAAALRDILQELLRLARPSEIRPEWRAGSALHRPVKRPSMVNSRLPDEPSLDAPHCACRSHRVKSCGPSGSQDLAFAERGNRPPL